MTFNPGAPGLTGLQWPVTREGVTRVDSPYTAAAHVFTSTATETIDGVQFYIPSVSNFGTKWEVEVYNLASTDSGAAGSTTYRPDTDLAVSGTIGNEAGAGNMFSRLDDTPLNGATWIQGGFGAPFPTLYTAQYASIAGTLTGKIITNVRLEAWCGVATGGTGTPTLTIRPYLSIDNVTYSGTPFSSDQPIAYFSQSWPYNPATGVSWRISDVEKFDTDADSGAGIFFDPTGSVNWTFRIFELYLIVDWGTTERRIALGTLEPTSPNWWGALLATPTGTDNWAKTSGLDYLTLLRRTSGGGTLTARYLDSGAACPHNGHRSAIVSFGGDRRLSAVVSSSETPAYGYRLLRTDVTSSADTQPYASAADDFGVGEVFFGGNWKAIGSLVATKQEFTPTSTAVRDNIAILVRAGHPTQLPGGPLVVQVKRRSDNVVMGSVSFPDTELVAPYRSWQWLRGLMTAGAGGLTLTNGVQYYVDVSATSISGDGSDAWEVQALSGLYASGFDAQNFGGTTNRFDWFTLVDQDQVDQVVLVGVAVTNVTNFAAAVSNVSLDDPATGECSLRTMQRVSLTWTATAHGGNFQAYEIQRWSANTQVWQSIAWITTESVAAFTDLEAPVGVQSKYRIRTIKTDQTSSAWFAERFAFVNWIGSHGLLFVTNESTALACGYVTAGPPERTYEFLNAQTIELHQLQGRNYQVAFRDAEERGVSFEVDCLLGGRPGPTRPGEPVFQALRDIADAPVSYVCVKDRDGNTWYASIGVSEGTRILSQVSDNYQATVRVVQVTDTPAPADSS